MCQKDIIKLLEKKNKWMTLKEIKDCLNLSQSSVNKSLQSLVKYGEIYKKGTRRDRYYFYVYKTK